MSLWCTELNNVKVYNVSSGKSLSQFLEEAIAKKKSLRYDKGEQYFRVQVQD